MSTFKKMCLPLGVFSFLFPTPLPLPQHLNSDIRHLNRRSNHSSDMGKRERCPKGWRYFCDSCSQVFQNIKRELWNIPQLVPVTETSVGDTESKSGMQRSHFCILLSQGWQEVHMLLRETKYRGCWLLAAKLSQIGAYHLTPLLPELWRSCLCLEFSEGSWRVILVIFFPYISSRALSGPFNLEV